jgi:broad specificity polyphosphatase/5'/3'-nucleotidase SurE
MKPQSQGRVGRILITNDDGIHAAGLKVLEAIA